MSFMKGASTPPPSPSSGSKHDDKPEPASSSSSNNHKARPAVPKYPPVSFRIQKESQLPKKRFVFHVQLHREMNGEKLGVRLEQTNYDFEGKSITAYRIRKIWEEGLVSKWNKMAVLCDMPHWRIQIDDVIAGMNGKMGVSQH